MPRAVSPADNRQTICSELDILQCNVTSLSNEVVRYIHACKYHIIFLQEHRLRGAMYFKRIHQLQSRYHIIAAPADIKHTAPSGGAMILIDKSLAQMPTSMIPCYQANTNLKVLLLRVKNALLRCFAFTFHPTMSTRNS